MTKQVQPMHSAADGTGNGSRQARSRWATAWIVSPLLIVLALPVHAELNARIEPNPLIVGETALLEITSDEGRPQLTRVPPVTGIEWLGMGTSGQSIQIINGNRQETYTLTYRFRATASGRFTIPPLTVRVGNRNLQTAPVTGTAMEGRTGGDESRTLSLDEAAYAVVRINGSETPPERVYVGQELTVEVRAYILQTVFQEIAYPEIQVENGSIRDVSELNPRSKHFLPASLEREIVDGMPFRTVPFVCRLTPLSRGRLQGRGTIGCRLDVQTGSRRRDLFDTFLDRGISHRILFGLPSVPIETPPPVPADMGVYLGLLGDWDIGMALDRDRCEVGQPVPLTMTVSGSGNVASLRPPALDFPDVRVHEPEVTSSPGATRSTARVTWILIPLREDVVLPRLQYCTFDPDSGTYRSHTFAPELEVTAARSGTTGPGLVADAGTIAPLGHRDRDRHAASDILYIKTELGEGVRLPLWRNTRTACLAFLLAAALVGGGLSLAGRHRARVLADPALQRRRRALRQRSRLRRTLADAGAEELPAVVTEEVMPYLTAVLGLPPGATAADVAGAVRDRCPELADILCEAERSRFRPGEPLRASGRDILGFLGRLSAFAVVLLSLAATAAEAQDLASQLQAEATLAYEQGELDAADARYRDVLENSDRLVHAGVLYNLGNCAYRRGRLGEAVAWYERARRLAPRDTDILENLNFVRGRLELPPVLDPRSPAELITRVRDSLRPDEWLLLLCLTLFVWALGVGVQRFRLRPVPVAVHIGALTVLLVCGAALAGQVTTSYRVRSHGVVVTDRAAPHSLPEATSTPLDLKLAEGESVRIMEERALWVRIRVDDAEAWLPREQVRTVW